MALRQTGSTMLRRLAPILVVAAAVLAAAAEGWLAPLDDWLSDQRFALTGRTPDGAVVVAAVDAKSIAALHGWPWPRRIYADLVDRLKGLGAAEIVLDIDFSAPSSPDDDAALAAALERAANSVILVAFDQKLSADDASGQLGANRPIAQFADHAWVANVDIRPDHDGRVRHLPYAVAAGGEVLPSLAATLGGGAGRIGDGFRVDFGIRAGDIDRVSVADILAGTVPADRIAGKKIIVGATAVELRDFFDVPVNGTVPGVLLQALGTESLLAGRALTRTGSLATLLGLALVIALAVFVRRRTWDRRLAVFALSALAVESVALAVQATWPVEIATGAWDVALLGFAVATLLSEIDVRRILIAISRTETRNLQIILDRVVADNFAGVLVVDEAGTILSASRSAAFILGIDRELVGRGIEGVVPDRLRQVLSRQIAELRAGVWHEEGQHEIVHQRGGREIVLEYVATPSRMDGGFAEDGSRLADSFAACLTFLDITERRRTAERTAYLARFDTLTGLPNRNQFIERLETELGRAGGNLPAVICLDLDRFKTVNDTLGHVFGDMLLRAIAVRLREIAGNENFVGRLGGDDFAIIIAGRDAEARAAVLASRLVTGMSVPHNLDGHRLVVAISVGIASAEPGDVEALATLKRADIALYRAKSNGGNSSVFFEPAMIAGLAARQTLEVELWDAFENGEFEVYYQPEIDLRDERIVGAEALLRWNHPTRGLVSPGEFIPVVEAIGLMEPLGRWVLAEACRTAVAWPGKLRLAVNVSAVQFTRGDLVEAVGSALATSGLPADRLDLEITESLFLQENRTIAATITHIGALGVSFVLDDFGTGYSSLAYIRKFPIDKIKIDRSFVTEIPMNPESVAIVRAVAALADSLGLRLIAEGIETAEQVKFLRLLGCHEGQGYLYAQPLAARDFVALIEGLKPRTLAQSRVV